jgi:hypothetical protein
VINKAREGEETEKLLGGEKEYLFRRQNEPNCLVWGR